MLLFFMIILHFPFLILKQNIFKNILKYKYIRQVGRYSLNVISNLKLKGAQ